MTAEHHAFPRVAIATKIGSPEAVSAAGELSEWLRRRGIAVALDERTHRALAGTTARPTTSRRGTTWWSSSAATAR